MIRHYAEPEGRVIIDHRHNAEESSSRPETALNHVGTATLRLVDVSKIEPGAVSRFPHDYLHHRRDAAELCLGKDCSYALQTWAIITVCEGCERGGLA